MAMRESGDEFLIVVHGNLLWDKLGEEASSSGNLALRSYLPGGCDFMPKDNYILSFKAFNEKFQRICVSK
jgi:hypothetical protein